jgi:glycosyltransferase involved in cell wall biosynthesis
MSLSVIALLGREDKPTDALEEYCRYLSEALRPHEIQLEIRRVPWEVRGWSKALQELERTAPQWHNSWVLLQYTALAWSARGFPQRILRIIRILKSAGARVGIVFHDVEPNHGQRLIDSLRRYVQVRTMRRSLTLVDLTIFTVAPMKLSWLGVVPPKSAFIPVGPNLPISAECLAIRKPNDVPTIGVFSITGGDPGVRETQTILAAVRYAAQEIGKLRLLVFGRHAELRETALREGLRDLPVQLSVEGVVDSAQVVQRLCASDVFLFVRGNISSRRGSAIAGIACGLPLIAFSGSETAPPITEAGVVLISPDRPDQLHEELGRVLSDSVFRDELAARSRTAYLEHFSWASIARHFVDLLHREEHETI